MLEFREGVMWTSGKQLGSHVYFALVLVFRRFDSDVMRLEE